MCRFGDKGRSVHPTTPPSRFRQFQLRWEQRISLLFNDCASEAIACDIDVRVEISAKKPDRVIGLRSTGKFTRLLAQAEDNRPAFQGQLLQDSLTVSPFQSPRDPILFPFLILEAKNERHGDGFSRIEVQTAFPIWTLLKLQHDLSLAAGSGSKWKSGPIYILHMCI